MSEGTIAKLTAVGVAICLLLIALFASDVRVVVFSFALLLCAYLLAQAMTRLEMKSKEKSKS